jgi:hypothetical protein
MKDSPCLPARRPGLERSETINVPTRAAYAGGSYDVTNTAVEVGSGEMLVVAKVQEWLEGERFPWDDRMP